MKHNQHKTKHKRIATTEIVHGNPMFGIGRSVVITGYNTPKEAHELNNPDWCKMNKKSKR